MVWLVIGGPLIVVIAAFATLIIAIRNPDEVLNTHRTVAAEDDSSAAKSALPAVEGRNHAVSPHVPGAAPGSK